MKISAKEKSNLIKNKAKSLGFDLCGIAKAHFLKDEQTALLRWLNRSWHGEMSYMKRNIEKRLNPTLLVENTKSIVVVGLNYFSQQQQVANAPVISKYAYGKDYHFVVKEKLNQLLSFINHEIEEVSGRAFVDSAPVLERIWAKKAGLGWIGKNSLLINRKLGSFLFLGELFLNIELENDKPLDSNFCGTCKRCMQACPTRAIKAPFLIDARSCISYCTIEMKGNELPKKYRGKFQNRIFGCDICQDVCPWNRKAKPHQVPELLPNSQMLSLSKEDWQRMDAHQFGQIFKKTALKRTKFENLKRNFNFLQVSSNQ